MGMTTAVCIATVKGREEAVARAADACVEQGAWPIVDHDTEHLGAIRMRNELFDVALNSTPPVDTICSLDDDAWPTLGALNVAAITLHKYPDVGAVAFDILRPGTPEPPLGTEPSMVPSYCAAGVAFRADALRDVGVWPDWEAGPFELEHSIRLQAAGWQIVRVPGVAVWHEVHPSGRVTGVRNRLVPLHMFELFVRYYPPRLAARKAAELLYRCALCSVEQRTPVYMGAAWEAAKRCGGWWKRREVVPMEVVERVRVPIGLVGCAV